MAEERERTEEETPDETFGETIREETAKHGEPPPKPSVFDIAKERVGKSIESLKAQRAADSAERKAIEAEKKAAVEQARRDRKEEEKAKEIQQAYDNERIPRRSPTEKLAAGMRAIQPFLSTMKHGISGEQTGQPRKAPPSWLTSGGSSGGFDITSPPKVERYQGSSTRLAILSTPQRSSLLSSPMFGAGRKGGSGGPLHDILFPKPARKMGKMGKKGSLPSLFSPSKMGVRIPKGTMMGLNLPKQGKRGRKNRSIFGY